MIKDIENTPNASLKMEDGISWIEVDVIVESGTQSAEGETSIHP